MTEEDKKGIGQIARMWKETDEEMRKTLAQ